MEIIEIFLDGLFAAIAAIGFTAISNPPRRVYPYCALIAAVGHSTRYILMNAHYLSLHIVIASTLAAFVVGTMAVLLSRKAKTPAETCLFPALLPMIPSIYAYKFFGAIAMCLFHTDESNFMHYFYLMSSNGFTCLFIILGMVIGATLPTFIFKRIPFTATR